MRHLLRNRKGSPGRGCPSEKINATVESTLPCAGCTVNPLSAAQDELVLGLVQAHGTVGPELFAAARHRAGMTPTETKRSITRLARQGLVVLRCENGRIVAEVEQ